VKIHFVTASISRSAGGLFESVRRLAQATAGGAYQVQVFGVEDEHSRADLSAWEPLEVHLNRRAGPERFSFAPGLLREMRSRDADLIMSHGLWRYTSIATHRWHKQTGLPYIVHPHGMLDSWAVKNGRRKKRIASFCYEAAHLRDAACIRALCEAEAVAIRHYGLTNPIAIIPNGVDLHETRIAGPQDHRANDNGLGTTGRKVLLFLGRIHPKKGLVNLLRAWKQVGADGWVLAIVGWDDGGHAAGLKQLCGELKLRWEEEGKGEREGKKETVLSPLSSHPSSCRVAFLGPQFDQAKSAYYRTCDAFILPSFSEGLPMAVLEAWSYGKPVLMTEHCHLPEGFAAVGAIKISPDPHELAHALNELVHMSGADLADMGNRGRELVKTRFNWQIISAQMRTVCDWVAGGGPRPDRVDA